MAKYTKEFREIITLNDEEYLVRSIRSSDQKHFLEAFEKLSKESLKNRFLLLKKGLTKKELVLFTDVNFENHVAFVLIKIEGERLLPVGTTRFFIDDKDLTRAEFAVTVLDDFQRKGMGKVLLKYLVDAAKEKNIQTLHGSASTENEAIERLLKTQGEVKKKMISSGVVELSLSV